MAAQATVSLEKAKRREPDKASIREALGIAYFRIRRYARGRGGVPRDARPLAGDDYAHYGLARCAREARPRTRRGVTSSSRARCGREASTTPRGRALERACAPSFSASPRRASWSATRWSGRSAPASASCSASRAGRRGRDRGPARRAHRPAADLRERRREVRPERPRHRRLGARRQQFTLIADTAKGNRPSFSAARERRNRPSVLYESFCATLTGLGVPVETGVFGARMRSSSPTTGR